MKNLVLFIYIFFLTVFFGYGQQLPNSDFEEWIEESGYQNPLDWNTPNEFTNLASTIVVDKSNDSYSGEYSARLETKHINFLGYEFLAPGLITLADFNVDILTLAFEYSGGFFLQQNVQKLTGMYKYQGVDNDSAVILMYNFRNQEGEDYDTIGRGYTYLHDAEEWTPFTVNMRYMNGHVPDTFNVLIMATTDEGLADFFHAGSIMFVDSLAIHTNTGILNLWEKAIALHVYPNPAASVINFETDKTGNDRKLIISDPSGKIILKKEFQNNIVTLPVSGFSAGIYIYSVTEGIRIVNSGSFIKK